MAPQQLDVAGAGYPAIRFERMTYRLQGDSEIAA